MSPTADPATHLAELELARPAAQDDLVAVLEEAPLRAVRQLSGRAPFSVSSISEPSLPGSAPEIVPDAIRSPVRTAAPFDVACASCCGIVQ